MTTPSYIITDSKERESNLYRLLQEARALKKSLEDLDYTPRIQRIYHMALRRIIRRGRKYQEATNK